MEPVRIISMRTVVNSQEEEEEKASAAQDEAEMSIFLIFLRFLQCKVLPGKVRESFRSSSFSVCHDRQDTNIKVLCKRINALNERVSAAGGGGGGGE